MPFPPLTPEDKVLLHKLTDFLEQHFNEQPMVAAQIMGACIAILLSELSDSVDEALLKVDAFAEDMRNAVRMDERWDINRGATQ